MAVPFYSKTARMSETIALDFSDVLPTGVTIASAIASARVFRSGVNATSEIFPNGTTCTIIGSNKVASIRADGGDAGVLYEIYILATFSDGQTSDGYSRLMVDE